MIDPLLNAEKNEELLHYHKALNDQAPHPYSRQVDGGAIKPAMSA